MKHIVIKYSALLVVAFCFAACTDKNAFVIHGKIKNAGAVKKLYLLDADTSQLLYLDSVTLSDSYRFTIKHSSAKKGLYKLLVGNTLFDFIAQNGDDIEFNTDYADTSNAYEIKNSEESEKLREFNKINNHYGNITDNLTFEYNAAVKKYGQNKSDSLMGVFLPRFERNMDEGSQKVLAYAMKNENSLVGYFAMKNLDRRKYEQQLVKYAEDVKGKFPGNFAVNTFINNILLLAPLSVGHPAPQFTVPGFDGQPVKLADYKGKYVMIDFWASWCHPCRLENPNVVKMYARFKNKGLNILGISLDTDKKLWKKAIDDDHLSWKHASELKNFDSPVVGLYHVDEIPSNYIIGPDGNIVAKNLAGTQLEDFLNKTFSKPQ